MKKIFALAITFYCAVLLFGNLSAMAGNLPGKDLKLKTSDGVNIAATIGIPENINGKAPAVILIHQGGSSREEWSSFYPMLLEAGYIVLAYDVRGHGKSDKVEDKRALFSDPNQAPNDLKAAINYLKKQANVDAARIAVVGASIGGNLACVAAGDEAAYGIKTAVAISSKTEAVYNLAGVNYLPFRSIYLISSTDDQEGKRARWARELYGKTEKPRKLEYVEGSAAHGVNIFKDDPKLQGRILAWLKETL